VCWSEGFNYEVLERVYSKTRFQFHMFDLAGKEALRPLWKHFYRNLKPHVVVFVVDASDKERIGEAKKEFQKLLHESDLFNSVVIVLANQKRVVKTDPLDTQMKESDIRYEMEVPREVVVIEVDAQETHELTHVMHHICQQLLKNKS